MFFRSIITSFFCAMVFLVLVACEPRGQLTTIPEDSVLPEEAVVHEIFVATTRARSDDGQVFGSSRNQNTTYARFNVSVPPTHVTGQIEWAKDIPDPAQHFVVQSGAIMSGEAAFEQALSRSMARLPPPERDVAVFVHGYNINFSEVLYRMTQAHHDFADATIPVLFTWPSAASTVGYLYDRDSTLLARDNLVNFIETVARSNPNELMLIAHSMGSYLLMEALRQIALTEGPGGLRGISGVILMSPDIDLQVFEMQARAIGTLPQPFIIFSSRADRALEVSRSLAGDERLGAVNNVGRLQDLDVTVVDVTALSEPGSLNHLITITSPEFIEIVRQLDEFDEGLEKDIAQSENVSMVEFFNRAREVTLSPFQN